MDFKVVLFVLGKLALACGLGLIAPVLTALYYSESSIPAFLTAIAVCFIWGQLLIRRGHRPVDTLSVREGIAITSLGWIMVTFLGMIPYAAGGYLTVLDGIFECISGLSGTGATVIRDLAFPYALVRRSGHCRYFHCSISAIWPRHRSYV